MIAQNAGQGEERTLRKGRARNDLFVVWENINKLQVVRRAERWRSVIVIQGTS